MEYEEEWRRTKMEVGETKKQRKQNMKEDEWRGTKKEDGETKKQRKRTCRQRNKGDKPFDIKIR